MPYDPMTNVFQRIWKFVDQFEEMDEIKRSDLDVALDDISTGVNVAVQRSMSFVGDWIASGFFPSLRPDLSQIQARDTWRVSSAGTVGGVAFEVDDYLVALRANPGPTYAGNWIRVPSDLTGYNVSLVQEAEDARDAALNAQALSEDNAEAAALARAAALAAAVEAGLYDGPKVDTFAGLSAVTPAMLATGALIRVIETGAVYERVTTDADLDYTGSGGVMLRRVRNPDVRLSDMATINDLAERGGGIVDGDASVAGVLETRANMRLDFEPGTTVTQTHRSVVGAFLTNVIIGDANDRIQTDISLDGGIISGEGYPAPVIVEIASATTTTLTFTAAASASNDAYNGNLVQILSGALANGINFRTISDYDGATRTATLSVALPSAPAAGTMAQIGYNDNAVGFGWGAEHVRIRDGISKGYPMAAMTPPGLGGKGLNFEQGARDAVVTGRTFEDCYTGLFISGHPGDLSNGYPRVVQALRASDLHFEDCGSAITAAILDGAAGIPSDPSRLQAVITGCTYHNCGHAPLRIVGSDQQKSGVINLMGANGVLISDVIGWNDPTYVADAGGYPTDYSARCGFGLSGPIGAVIWGHARNCTLRNIHHHGDADCAVHVGRVRALGDDAPGGSPSQMFGWDIDGLHIYGTIDRVVNRDLGLGVVNADLTGYWRIVVDTVTTGFLHPSYATTTTGLILDITERATGKRIIGTAARILARGNTFADYPAGVTDLRTQDRRSFTIADDAAVSFTPLSAQGVMTVISATNLASNLVRYEADASPQCNLAIASAATAATTGVLTGTTGTDGNLTFSAHTDWRVYIENRRGATISLTLTMPVA